MTKCFDVLHTFNVNNHFNLQSSLFIFLNNNIQNSFHIKRYTSKGDPPGQYTAHDTLLPNLSFRKLMGPGNNEYKSVSNLA